MSEKRIVIVDDNPINLKLLRVLLMNDGYAIRTATTAEEARAILFDFHPRVILMDLQLPGMDGLTLTRLLKAAPETSDIAIVAVTSYAMKSDQVRAFAAGCDAFVSKPIDTELLPKLVATYFDS